MKKISHILEFLFVMLLFCIVNLFPFRSLHSLAVAMECMFYPFLVKGRARIRFNLKTNLGYQDGKPLEKFIRENFRHTIRITLEIFQSWKFRKKKNVDKYFSVSKETLNYVRQRDKGMVVVEGHFGNWELPIIILGAHGIKFHFSAKKMSNPFVDSWLHKVRTRYGGGDPIYLKESSKFIPLLRQKEPIGLVSDQDAGGEGVFVDFLGRKASTHQGPAVFAYLGKARLGVGFCLFQGKGRYHFEVTPVYEFQAKSDYISSEDAGRKLTEEWVHVLEKKVREFPEQYFWIHRRWKTRPPAEEIHN